LDHVEKNPGVKLLLCFANVEYMSSSTLTELIKVKEAVEGSGGKLGICSLRPDVRRVFQITNLEEHLNVYAFETIDEAIQAFEANE
jgi:anti-anti-sigma factor